jgi:hypothetical protein
MTTIEILNQIKQLEAEIDLKYEQIQHLKLELDRRRNTDAEEVIPSDI